MRVMQPLKSVEKLILVPAKSLARDSEHEFAGLHSHPDFKYPIFLQYNPVEIDRVRCDEEDLLKAIKPSSQEAVVSCLSLHWVNDLPGDMLI